MMEASEMVATGVTVIIVLLILSPVLLVFYGGFLLVRYKVLAWKPLSNESRAVLERHFPYYAEANGVDRRNIRSRVSAMMREKEWVGRGMAVTPAMKTMVCACAVQLMWGWEDEDLLYFKRVLIYPDRFRSRLSDQDHVGELNPGFGVLAISWKHFTEGYAERTDGRNLGLHEMGHALWVGIRKEGQFLTRAEQWPWKRWRHLAEAEAERIRTNTTHLFRGYAATDQAEFFAVAVEYFFERPVEYREQLPDLYACMCQLLKQDPAALHRAVPPPPQQTKGQTATRLRT
jgi:MtfA peptidase